MDIVYRFFKNFLIFLRDLLEGFRILCPTLHPRKARSWKERRNLIRKPKYRDSDRLHEVETGSLISDDLEHDVPESDLDAPFLSTGTAHFPMHRPKLEDRFGTLRFRVEYLESKSLLLVTLIDAWDLPPMDADGKADPYVEVSLRPGHKKYTSTIKYNCLNPTYNETAELAMKPEEIVEKDLVLKVLDSDYPQQDELIGVVRLPVSGLDLTYASRPYTCLILHDKAIQSRTGERRMSSADAAKLNLKISLQEQELYDKAVKMRNLDDRLQELREEHSNLKGRLLEIDMERVRYESCDYELNPEEYNLDAAEDSNSLLEAARLMIGETQSAPVSKGSSPMFRRNKGQSASEAADGHYYRLLTHLKDALVEKDVEIEKLRKYLKELKPQLELQASRNGQIELGLGFFPITSQLRIDVVSAANLRAVNLYGDHSGKLILACAQGFGPIFIVFADPFAKVKIFWHRQGGKTQIWKFSTKTVWKTINPIWNEHFILPEDVTEEDLVHIHVEVTVLDRGRLRSAQPLGKVRLGPNTTGDRQHWEEMVKHHGNTIRMLHALKDV